MDMTSLAVDPEVHGYEFISISWSGSSPSGKTQIYDVTNNRTGYTLGTIKWYGAWWQYVFVPDGGTLYSRGCLRDIESFIDSLHHD